VITAQAQVHQGGYAAGTTNAAVQAHLRCQSQMKDPKRELRKYLENDLEVSIPDGNVIRWCGVRILFFNA
jgi:hypothetical protein